jgi:L-ascorbate metabolism protein UlaG (beta-lactamase superfamily)
MLITVFFLLILLALAYLFLDGPQFGRAPAGERLERIRRSPNFREGQFQNVNLTPALAEGSTYPGVMYAFFFKRKHRNTPASPLPGKKTDISQLNPSDNVLIWFGHSSYFMQLDGKKFLVDPVFSGRASPVSFTTRAFKGSDLYTTEDLPPIDYLFISHDHYDHLDFKTVQKLKEKVGRVITGLGVGAHLEHWGYDPAIITELDWGQDAQLDEGFSVHAASARHFSGRRFKRNNTLWISLVLQTPTKKLYLGGDSGYDTHFALIGKEYGPFDLAILENGQYNRHWKYIHMMPEEVVQAAEDLQARMLMPVHWSKFSLALHEWDEPIKRVNAEASKKRLPLLHPMIGEAVDLNNPQSTAWWQDL